MAKRTVIQRWWAHVDPTGPVPSGRPDLGPCWIWATPGWRGYGSLRVAGRMEKAHRVAVELFVGPIPPDYEVHHICRNPRCVRPDHLQALSRFEHYVEHPRLFGQIAAATRARRAATPKTHCKHGHPLSGDNLYAPPKRPHQRHCRECHRRRSRKSAARKAQR